MAKILIAEDDHSLREVMASELTNRGHLVVAAPDGKSARDLFQINEFDLVICDVQMPYLNGVELLQWTRTRSEIPFLLMTGLSDLVEKNRAMQLGATAFLTKPFPLHSLLETIAQIAPLPRQAMPQSEANNIKVS